MVELIIEIDGREFSTLEGFVQAVWPLLTGQPFDGTTNLDAFNDILSWPEMPFTLLWTHSALSRERLNHLEIARKLEDMLHTCHSSNRESVLQRIEEARNGRGPSMFDWLVEIFEDNGPRVTLRLT
jgi:RNAse (barnase) inhibitor barstar